MKPHQLLKRYIEGTIKGYSKSLIVVSPAGFGKTEAVFTTLKELNLTEGKEFIYVSNYITPLELYLLLEKVNDLENPRLLVIDDGEDTLSNKRAIGLLKGALWGFNDKFRVEWRSGTHKIKTQSFNFTGRIIFLLNELNKKSAIISALKDRSLFFEMRLEVPEMFELMKERAELPYHDIPINKRREIVEFLERISSEKSNISLRTLPKAFNLYLLSPNSYQYLLQKTL